MNIIWPPSLPFRMWFVHFVWFLPRFTWLSASTMSFWLTPHKLAVSRSHFLWQFTSHSGSRVAIRFSMLAKMWMGCPRMASHWRGINCKQIIIKFLVAAGCEGYPIFCCDLLAARFRDSRKMFSNWKFTS